MADIDSSKSYDNPTYGTGGPAGGPAGGPGGPSDGFTGPSGGGGGGFTGPSGGGLGGSSASGFGGSSAGGFGGPGGSTGGSNRIGFENFDNPGTNLPQMPSVPGPNAGLAYPPPQVIQYVHLKSFNVA